MQRCVPWESDLFTILLLDFTMCFLYYSCGKYNNDLHLDVMKYCVVLQQISYMCTLKGTVC